MPSRTTTSDRAIPSTLTGIPVAEALPVFCAVRLKVKTSRGAAMSLDTVFWSAMLAPSAVRTVSVTVRVAPCS